MKEVSIDSINYQFSDCITEIMAGSLFGVLGLLSLLNVLPLETLMFFLIPCVFIFGWCVVKFNSTPEILSLTCKCIKYSRGSRLVFKINLEDIEKISWGRGDMHQLFYDKLFVLHYANGSERSFPYRYLSDQQLKSISDILDSLSQPEVV